VRYPRAILQKFALEGIHYCGWLPNFRVPEIFANHRVTLHVPRRYYVSSLPGVPTIRPFEAMACGIPLVSAPWDDNEGLFTAGVDYLLAKDGQQMRRHLHALLHDGDLALAQSEQALKTIRTRHTCAHRVDQLLTILDQLNPVHPHMNSAGEIRLHA
jgi:spore maturation protein CgeB